MSIGLVNLVRKLWAAVVLVVLACGQVFAQSNSEPFGQVYFVELSGSDVDASGVGIAIAPDTFISVLPENQAVDVGEKVNIRQGSQQNSGVVDAFLPSLGLLISKTKEPMASEAAITQFAINQPKFKFDVTAYSASENELSSVGLGVMIPSDDGKAALASADFLNTSSIPTKGGVLLNECSGLVALVLPESGAGQQTLIFADDLARQLSETSTPGQTAAEDCVSEYEATKRALDDAVATNADLVARIKKAEDAAAAATTQAELEQMRRELVGLNKELEASNAIIAQVKETISTMEPTEEASLALAEQATAWLSKYWYLVLAALVAIGILIAVLFQRRHSEASSFESGDRFAPPNPIVNAGSFMLESDAQTIILTGDALSAPKGVTVGRSAEVSDVVVANEDVSRRHARFDVFDGNLRVSDLGSTNKTLVNDVPVESGTSKTVFEGDRVAFGSVAFLVRRRTDAS